MENARRLSNSAASLLWIPALWAHKRRGRGRGYHVFECGASTNHGPHGSTPTPEIKSPDANSSKFQDDAISKSRLISSDGAEWVSAPDEIRSTPVAATSARVSRVIPPDAS